jgi:hypothetical protein
MNSELRVALSCVTQPNVVVEVMEILENAFAKFPRFKSDPGIDFLYSSFLLIPRRTSAAVVGAGLSLCAESRHVVGRQLQDPAPALPVRVPSQGQAGRPTHRVETFCEGH